MPEKPLLLVGSPLADLRDFPDEARRLAGHQLHLVQQGLEPDDWKPIPTVGPGVAELRVHMGVAHRVFYVAKFAEAVRPARLREAHAANAHGRSGARAPPLSGSAPCARSRRGLTQETANVGETMPKPKLTRSSGNVFRDLGFPAEEAEHLRLRSQLMIEVRKLIERRGLTQKEAALLFGVTQPRISDLVRGKIELFSIDTLVDMLAQAGARVDLVVGRVPA